MDGCTGCVDYKFKDNKKSVCCTCLRKNRDGHDIRYHYLELNKQTPECCGKCSYNKKFDTDNYCEAARYFNTDDRKVSFPYIRKNYLKKGKPKFCPYVIGGYNERD